MRLRVRSEDTRTAWDARAAAHLLSRAAFGGTPAEVARLAAGTREEAVDGLLDAAVRVAAPTHPDWVRTPWINTERRFADTPEDERARSHRDTRRRYASELNALRSWWLGQMLRTEAPLREVMTLFWHGHFATATSKVAISQAIYEQNATLRKHALGNFRELLGALTLDPAMMLYLDLEDSDRSKPNENYARELYELFTVGIGNYTENDIKQTARALTGWTLAAPPARTGTRANAPDTPRDFARDGLIPTFVPHRHDTGVKTVSGRTGNLGVKEVLDRVALRDETGRFLGVKLLAFFGVVDPEGTLRDRLAAAFAENRGEIRPVLRTLFTAPEFYGDASRGSMIKSPVHLLVGTCRQLGLEAEPTPSMAQLTAAMGQELFNPPNVKGWPGGKAWITAGTLAVRYHLPDALFDGKDIEGLEPLGFNRFFALPRDPEQRRAMMGRMAGAMTERQAERRKEGIKSRLRPAAVFPAGPPPASAALVDALLDRLVVTTVRPATRAALVAACESAPPADRVAVAARLIVTSPEYQMA